MKARTVFLLTAFVLISTNPVMDALAQQPTPDSPMDPTATTAETAAPTSKERPADEQPADEEPPGAEEVPAEPMPEPPPTYGPATTGIDPSPPGRPQVTYRSGPPPAGPAPMHDPAAGYGLPPRGPHHQPPGSYHHLPPPPPPPPPPLRERNSVALMVTGIVLTSIGGVGLIVGSSLLSSSRVGGCVGRHCSEHVGVGIGLSLGGLAFVGAGVPMIVVGAKRVPVRRHRGSLVPSVAVSGHGGALTWSF